MALLRRAARMISRPFAFVGKHLLAFLTAPIPGTDDDDYHPII